jgi:hypothetical protein
MLALKCRFLFGPFTPLFQRLDRASELTSMPLDERCDSEQLVPETLSPIISRSRVISAAALPLDFPLQRKPRIIIPGAPSPSGI